MEVTFCKEWNIELATVAQRLRVGCGTVKLDSCRSPASCDGEKVAVERHSTRKPFGVRGSIDACPEKLLCFSPVAPAEVQFGLCLHHHRPETCIVCGFCLLHGHLQVRLAVSPVTDGKCQD